MSKIYSFDQITDSVELLEKKPPRFIAILLSFLGCMIIGCIIWAWVGTMDIVNKGTAIIQESDSANIIRLPIGGTVETICVKNGEEVKQGDTLLQLKNIELDSKQQQLEQVIQQKNEQKNMLEEFKKSIQIHKPSFSKQIDVKIKEEYKAYDQGYQALQVEKENEIQIVSDSKVSNEQDDRLQGLLAQKENVQREIDTSQKQVEQSNIGEEQKQIEQEKRATLESQKTIVEKQIKQRTETLESDQKKIENMKKGKEQQKQHALEQYKESAIVAVNQRIQTVEQETMMQKNELIAIQKQKERLEIKAPKGGIIQFEKQVEQGELIDVGQEMLSIVSKENKKKVKLFLSPDEMNGIKKGNQVQYRFQLKSTDKQKGTITYIAKQPIFDKSTKMYVYELEATIENKQVAELQTGMIGKVSIVTGTEPIWKFFLKKLNLHTK
ncbi:MULTISPECIES: HlyD family secretion protein [unclassified Bacillus (in: firmicutes)]|uniref:HlyD family secretion protein n=1 Tax=unclassified Bacillus (in: firmicutes) TaxID=185979 RepID=UPI0030F64A06